MLHTRWNLTVLFVVAVFLRIAAQLALGAYAHPQTWEYEDIANNLLSGGGYTYVIGGVPYVAAVSSPLYVLLSAGMYAVTAHSQAAMLLLEALFGGATAMLAGWLAGRATRAEAAWLAGGLVAVDPALLVYSAELHPLSLDALAFMAVICACVALPRYPQAQQTALVGLGLGLAALTRTTVLSLTPMLLLWAKRYRSLRLVSIPAAALVVVAVLVYCPWPIRNSMLLGQFVGGSSESNEWLWRGTNPNATGSSLSTDGQTMLEESPPDFQARIAAASESERMAIYRDATIQFAREHPVEVLRLYVLKLKAFVWGSDTTGALYPVAWTMLYEAWYAAMLVLGAVGVWYSWRQPQARLIVQLILASIALVAVSQAVFYVEGRHRLALEPMLLVLSGIGASQLASTYQPRFELGWLRRPRNDLT